MAIFYFNHPKFKIAAFLSLLVIILTVATTVYLAVNSNSLDPRSHAAGVGPTIPPLYSPKPIATGGTRTVCADIYSPVCSDKKTYSNSCVAAQNNAVIDCNHTCPCPNQAFFSMVTSENSKNKFIIKLTDKTKIDQARLIVSGKLKNYFPNGQYRTQITSYNPSWGFVYVPTSVEFVQSTIEECDATVQYIQDHLNTRPNGIWCPWSGRLTAEVYPQ